MSYGESGDSKLKVSLKFLLTQILLFLILFDPMGITEF